MTPNTYHEEIQDQDVVDRPLEWVLPNDGLKRSFLGWYGNVPVFRVEDDAALAQPPEPK